jgi:hypothetical protein
LNRALGDLPKVGTKQQYRELLGTLEDELHETTDAVDQLIARFAENAARPMDRELGQPRCAVAGLDA